MTAPAPAVCTTCGGGGLLSAPKNRHGFTVKLCTDCRCLCCGRDTLDRLCEDCSKEETWPTPNPTPPGPTANPRTRDGLTSTSPTPAESGSRQAEGTGHGA